MLTDDEKRRLEQYSYAHVEKYDFELSGKLQIELLNGGGWSTVCTIRDGDKVRIEAKQRAEEAERQAIQKKLEEEEEERQRIEEARRQEERKRQEDLFAEVKDWERSRRIRRYIGAVRKAALSRYGRIEQGSEMDQWLTWAGDVADQIDPLPPDEESAEWVESTPKPR